MIISNSLKYVYIHIPKTGGTSIRSLLYDVPDLSSEIISHWASITEEEYKKYPKVTSELKTHSGVKSAKLFCLRHNLNWNNYFKFAFVRNPYDLQVSNWKYLNKQYNKQSSFEEYLNLFETKRTGFQSNYICDNEKIEVDFIGKFENINQDWLYIVNKIIPGELTNTERFKLPKLNVTNHKHYLEYYTPKLISLVNKSRERDFEIGDYEML